MVTWISPIKEQIKTITGSR